MAGFEVILSVVIYVSLLNKKTLHREYLFLNSQTDVRKSDKYLSNSIF